ncbi:MAG: DDE-type integrase/transposase/recombinase [Clostridia bacterium]|nr:DDE-type integrase/transposase/recombinase [Clostridia bacterium]
MKRPSTYLKLRVLGAIDYAQGKSIRDRIRKISETDFIDEDGNPRRFTWRTISTWLYRYKLDGVTTMINKKRSDAGKTRKVSPEELLEAINQVIPLFREKGRWDKSDIYRACLEKGLLSRNNIAPTTFYRFIRDYELLKPDDQCQNKLRMAFSMQYANQLWQADTMFGPHIKHEGKMVQSKLIAYIDDASRLVVHGQFYPGETSTQLVSSLRSAFYKRGVPEQLYVDNGSIYAGQELTLVCARVGCILRHTPVRDGAAKGKIERFFRTVRDHFLSRELDFSSFASLNKLFTTWLEEAYNASVHSSTGMKPIDRFGLDHRRIRYLPPDQVTDELFYCEDTRKVKKDNTFSFSGSRFEAPATLHGKEIQIRFDRFKKDRVVVYYKGNRIGEAKYLDLIANGIMRNKALQGSIV